MELIIGLQWIYNEVDFIRYGVSIQRNFQLTDDFLTAILILFRKGIQQQSMNHHLM